MRTYGGVLTINWHTRSLSPERNWDEFYIELLKIPKAENVWFANAKQAVKWFNMRRSIHFDEIKLSKDKIQLKLSSNGVSNLPQPFIRVYIPRNNSLGREDSCGTGSFMDIPWTGKPEIEFAL